MAGHAATTSFAGPLDIPHRAGGIADDGFDDARFGDLQAAAEDVLFRFRGGSNHRVGFPWFGGLSAASGSVRRVNLRLSLNIGILVLPE